MLRSVFWGSAWLLSGLVFLGFAVNAVVGLVIPLVTIWTWNADDAGLVAICVVVGVVMLKLLLALASYNLVSYCWSRVEERKAGRIARV